MNLPRALAISAALAASAVAAPAADARPLPDLPIQCGVAGCPGDGVKECVENGIGALNNWLQGTPQPGTCDPS